MKIISTRSIPVQEVFTDKGTYLRLSPLSWCLWQGDSLELEQFPEELEAAYQAHVKAMTTVAS